MSEVCTKTASSAIRVIITLSLRAVFSPWGTGMEKRSGPIPGAPSRHSAGSRCLRAVDLSFSLADKKSGDFVQIRTPGFRPATLAASS